ncbi:hypothetical protein [Bacillus wiedmannii]|uniref:hypothetical protein n=1 Tax=Bacillus wiedmannii TaxID=1890302 RepID=UPI003D99003D
MSWYVRHPELYDKEEAVWLSFAFVLQEEILKKTGRIQFNSTIQEGETAYELEIKYLVGYPYISPKVICKNTKYKRHQMPLSNELCLFESDRDYGIITASFLMDRIQIWIRGQKEGFSSEMEAADSDHKMYHWESNVEATVLIPEEVYTEWGEWNETFRL